MENQKLMEIIHLILILIAQKFVKYFIHLFISLKMCKKNIFFQATLFPGIFIYWKKYQAGLIEKAQQKDKVVLAGDARHDSMGHSAKYGVYSMFSCPDNGVIHFEQVQVRIELSKVKFKSK